MTRVWWFTAGTLTLLLVMLAAILPPDTAWLAAPITVLVAVLVCLAVAAGLVEARRQSRRRALYRHPSAGRRWAP